MPNKKFKPTKHDGDIDEGRKNPHRNPRKGKDYDQGDQGSKKDAKIKTLGSNDPKWYYKNEQWLKDAASIPFNRALGLPLPYAQDVETVIPGILTMEYHSLPGVSKDGVSAINVCARAIYQFVRHYNSGSKNYEAVDLMLYILGYSDIIARISYIRRTLDFVYTYAQQNRYFAKAITEACGFDYDDAVANAANYRSQLNNAIAKINAFAVPKDFTYIKRRWHINETIYADSPDVERSQLYAYVPDGYYEYDQTTPPGRLKFYKVGVGTKIKLSKYMEYLNNSINKLITSEDANVMSGDILKAYGEGNVYQLAYYTPVLNMKPVYNRDMILQIMNTRAFGDVIVSAGAADITQNSGNVICNPRISNDSFAGVTTPESIIDATGDVVYLNVPSISDTTPERVLYATRLLPAPIHSASQGEFQFSTAGAEIVTLFRFATMNQSSAGAVNSSSFTSWIPTFIPIAVNLIAGINKFDWRPQMMGIEGSDSTATALGEIFDDLAVTTSVSREALSGMHDLAMMSLFGLPEVGFKK